MYGSNRIVSCEPVFISFRIILVLINIDVYWGTRRYVVMAALKSIVDIYGVSSYEKRIDIILDRYT